MKQLFIIFSLFALVVIIRGTVGIIIGCVACIFMGVEIIKSIKWFLKELK